MSAGEFVIRNDQRVLYGLVKLWVIDSLCAEMHPYYCKIIRRESVAPCSVLYLDVVQPEHVECMRRFLLLQKNAGFIASVTIDKYSLFRFNSLLMLQTAYIVIYCSLRFLLLMIIWRTGSLLMQVLYSCWWCLYAWRIFLKFNIWFSILDFLLFTLFCYM